ncbi:CASP-like protein 2C4 [Dichanthelium oligosanthes]|uniref:CASP-like protein n=1 Tax=Dichanthelium oligosanthes TaxID=888268 RepID=A0A1E5W9U5_9POAL|nr:CASP-like protein 2C4 [Dichanthelium oligosanthes]
MAAVEPSSSVRVEYVLRGACAAMAAAGALLLGLSAQTKTVLFIQKKAVAKDVEALWYALSFPTRTMLLLITCRSNRSQNSPGSFSKETEINRSALRHVDVLACSSRVLIVAAAAAAGYHVVQLARCLYMGCLAGGAGSGCWRLRRGVACVSFLLDKGCAYMVFAATVAALQACFVALIGVEALQWSKVCNIYTRFCEEVAAGMVCSLLAAVGMAVLSAFSAREVFLLGRRAVKAQL